MIHSIQELQARIATVPEDATISVNLKDLIFIYKAIEECRTFMHNGANYPTLKEVSEFIGNRDEGMYSILNHIYVNIFDGMLTKDQEDL